jgi:signal peptidase I
MMLNQTENESTRSRVNKEPWLAVNLSKLLPGMGQIYAGSKTKGSIVVFLYLSSLPLSVILAIHQHTFPFGVALLIFNLVILPIWNLFDAYHVAKQQNSLEFEAERRQSPDAWLAVFLSSFIPGVGHAYLQKWLLAIIFIALFVATFIGVFSPNPIIAIVSSLSGWIVSILALYNAYTSAPVIRNRSRRTVLLFIAGLFLLPITLSTILAISIRSFIAEARYIPAGSMLPTLQINDRLIVDKFIYRYSNPQRGDIIVFNPNEQLERENYKDAFIKRIIGIPGDRVEVKGGKVYINNQVLVENYIEEPPTYNWSSKSLTPDGIIPPDRYLVLGDNRNNSYDSHYWGFVPREKIIGKATSRFYPFERLGFLTEK